MGSVFGLSGEVGGMRSEAEQSRTAEYADMQEVGRDVEMDAERRPLKL